MTALKSNIAVEVTVQCHPMNQEEQSHRIWITRAGEIETPDHHSDSEEVTKALGGNIVNTCTYWQAIPLCLNSKSDKIRLSVPKLDSWHITDNPFWTSRVSWLALSAILGSATYSQLDPALALEHSKIFQRHGYLEVSQSIVNELLYLQFPASRAGGFRRGRVTSTSELEALIDLGLPLNRVATIAALDITANDLVEVVSAFKAHNIPLDIIVNLGYSIPGNRIKALSSRLNKDNLETLSTRLSKLSENSKELVDNDIENFLLGEIK